MDMAEIGANIRSCRTEKDMTMEELGKAIGKSQSAVADYEKGRVDIPASSLIKIAGETYDYSGRYAKEKADKLLKGYEALKLFGWFFEMDEEKRVLDGTSELFAPAEEK